VNANIEIRGNFRDLTSVEHEAIRTSIVRYLNGESADEVVEDSIAKRCNPRHKDSLSWNFVGEDGKAYRCIFPKTHTPGRFEGALFFHITKRGNCAVSFTAFYSR